MVAATNTPAGSFIVATVESGLVTGPAFFVFRPLWFYTTNRGDRMDWCCTAAVTLPMFWPERHLGIIGDWRSRAASLFSTGVRGGSDAEARS